MSPGPCSTAAATATTAFILAPSPLFASPPAFLGGRGCRSLTSSPLEEEALALLRRRGQVAGGSVGRGLTARAQSRQGAEPEKSESESKRRRMWLAKVPNALTAFRVAAVPVLALLFYAPPYLRIWCPWIFIFASITDLLDGWIARRYKLCSAFGAFLDPVADKLMVAMAMVLLSERLGALVAVCSGVTLCREIGVSALREWMAELGKRATVKVGFAGKCKTTLQMVALGALLIYASGDCPSGAEASVLLLGEVTLVLSTILATTSGVGYLQAAWPSLMEQDS